MPPTLLFPAPSAARTRLPVIAAAPREATAPLRPSWFDTVPATIEDAQGRRVRYVRLSIADRCDLACVYCMPPSGEEDHAPSRDLLDAADLSRLARLLARSGITRFRFTGGEPLVRRDALALVAAVHEAAPDIALAMTTNATRLAELATPLARAGLRSVNVSLDTLDAVRFRAVTRGGELAVVLAGIHAALDAGLDVKLNAVLLGEESIAEAPRLVDFAWSLGVVPRFIELMPLGEGATLPHALFVSASHVVAALGDRVAGVPSQGGPDRGPARELAARDGSGRRVGFISAMTDEFCGTCNRLRISARGEVRPCLGSPDGVSLRDALRTEPDDVALAWQLHAALRTKASGHGFVDPTRDAHTRVGMSLIGG